MIIKKIFCVAALTLAAAAAHATVTINIGLGNVYFSNGTTPAPEGSLLQLLASTTDNFFSAPTPGSFTGDSTDDVVLASFTINNGPGSFLDSIEFTLGGNLGPGDMLLLRWFPTLTLKDAAPGAGTEYGQFRTDMEENFSTIAWIVPSDGSINDLNFATEAQGGTRAEAEGAANLVVVPEPSTYALMAVGLAGLVAARRRRKQNAA